MLSAFHHHLSTAERGVLGTVTSIGSAALSLTNVEVYLRMTGLVIGILVGVATLVSVLHDIAKKRREK